LGESEPKKSSLRDERESYDKEVALVLGRGCCGGDVRYPLENAGGNNADRDVAA